MQSPLPKTKMIQSFRGEVRAPLPLHPMELVLVIVACVHLCFLPWALGARSPWAQVTSCVLGFVAFLLAMLPRHYSGELAPKGGFILHPWSRVLKFPVFWLGLLFLGYVACQALNPAYRRATAGPYWWLAQIEHISWLPSGVIAPFERMNAWRMLLFWGGGWALGCALWAGLTRRIGIQVILTTLVINGSILALLGILQKVTQAKGILWAITSVPDYFVSTFYYKNHASAYFNLIACLSATLAIWHHTRSIRHLPKSSPTPAYAFATIVIAALIFMTGSRSGMLLFAAFALVSTLIFGVWRARRQNRSTNPVLSALLAIATVALLTGAFWFLGLDKTVDDFRRLASAQGQQQSIEARVLARQATLDLFSAKPITGWGAGSFRHIFPIAQSNYDPIFRAPGPGGRMFSWDHAHNDYVQMLAEVGLAGFSLPVLMFGWLLVRGLRRGLLAHPAFVIGAVGLSLPLAHAWVDFPLSNCAIFTTFCAAWVLVVRWVELENNR